MYTRITTMTLMMMLASPAAAQQPDHAAAHGGQIYHHLRVDIGTGFDEHGEHVNEWELDGRIGTDENRLRFSSDGLYSDGRIEQADVRLRYNRSISTYWDAEIGIRQDIQPISTSWLTFGISGLAPYFFETDLHASVSDNGDIGLQLRQENDLLLTQRLILQPALAADVFLQDIPELDIAAGLSRLGAGLQLRYEFSRELAPYMALNYERKIGETASRAIANGHDRDTINMTIGLRLLF